MPKQQISSFLRGELSFNPFNYQDNKRLSPRKGRRKGSEPCMGLPVPEPIWVQNLLNLRAFRARFQTAGIQKKTQTGSISPHQKLQQPGFKLNV